MIFYCFTTVENLIPETIFPDTIPNVLHWVELRAVRREEDQRHVDWHPENESRAWEREIDGKLLLETTNKTLSPT